MAILPEDKKKSQEFDTFFRVNLLYKIKIIHIPIFFILYKTRSSFTVSFNIIYAMIMFLYLKFIFLL